MASDQFSITHYCKAGKWSAFSDSRKFTRAGAARLWAAGIVLQISGKATEVDAVRFDNNLEYRAAVLAGFFPAATQTAAGDGHVRFTVDYDHVTGNATFTRE